jgi:hypothetical protein
LPISQHTDSQELATSVHGEFEFGGFLIDLAPQADGNNEDKTPVMIHNDISA